MPLPCGTTQVWLPHGVTPFAYGRDIPHHTYDVALLRNGGFDPTTRVHMSTVTGSQNAHIERATLTPDGPGTISIHIHQNGEHEVRTWGAGGAWLGARQQRLSARATEMSEVHSRHAAVSAALRDVGQLHLPATDTPYHELLPAVLGQRITAAQAFAQWAALCRRYGEPAPGPLSLFLPPSPERLLAIPSWEFHRLGIERQRARALVTVARHARYVQRTAELPGTDARRALMQLPGIGEWTAAVAVGVSHGDVDALPVGDFHVKNTVAWALTGAPRGSDEQMLITLAPYTGYRWQVVRLLEKHGVGAPKFAPKRRILDISRL